jgi:hypothetical protein
MRRITGPGGGDAHVPVDDSVVVGLMPPVSADRAAPTSGQARACSSGLSPMLAPRVRGTMGWCRNEGGGRAFAGVAVAAWLLAAAGYLCTVVIHARLGGGRDDHRRVLAVRAWLDQ